MERAAVSATLDGSTWTSANEHLVTEAERTAVRQLEQRDAEIGQQVAAKYGRGALPKRSLPAKVVRRAVFEAKKLAGPFAKRVVRAGSRRWYRYVADRSRIADGTRLVFGDAQVEVHALNGQPDLAAELAATTATHWILTRTPDQLLTSAVPHIQAAVQRGAADLWFGDSRSMSGVRERRPAFSRLLMRQVDVLGPVIACPVAVLKSWGQAAAIAPELWPLAVSLSVPADRVALIPEVLGIGDVTEPAPERLIDDAVSLVRNELQQSSLSATVSAVPLGRRRVSYAVSGTPKVSIVIPTRGSVHAGRALVTEAVRSILQTSSYPNIELVIVADDPTPQSVIDEIDQIGGSQVKWVRWSEPFNFSQKMNLGAAVAQGEYLLLLNDDVEVVSADWIERMLSLIGVDGIGYVGALLFFEDATIQHGGHFYAGGAGHIGIGEPLRAADPNQLFNVDRRVSGLTAACGLISHHLFGQVGGFSMIFPGNYNDVDLALKLRERDIPLAVSAGARLYHFESKTRNATVLRSELLALHERWYAAIQTDAHWRQYEGV